MSVRRAIVEKLETMFRFMYSWIAENDEVLGSIIYFLHLFGFFTLLVLIFVSHTIYPMFWLQAFVFGFFFIVWVQHVILKTCVLTSIERRLLGPNSKVMIDMILNLFEIPIQKETRMGVTLMLSSVGVMFLGLELVARSVMYGRQMIGASMWI